jgi:hypothetical protein
MPGANLRLLDDISRIERDLVGFNLGDLIADLPDESGEPRGAEPLGEILGLNREDVLKAGLSRLPRPALERLLQRPGLLLDLQEIVLCEGGEYWQRLSRSARRPSELTSPDFGHFAGDLAAIDLSGRVVKAGRGRRPERQSADGTHARPAVPPPVRRERASRRLPALAVSGWAVSVLLAAVLLILFRGPAERWRGPVKPSDGGDHGSSVAQLRPEESLPPDESLPLAAAGEILLPADESDRIVVQTVPADESRSPVQVSSDVHPLPPDESRTFVSQP